LVDLRKIQYARDDERPHFCINLNNIDNEVYCDFIVMLTSFQSISSINYGQSNQLYIPRVKLEAARKSFYTYYNGCVVFNKFSDVTDA
jgi:hypothetical protein